MHTGDEICLKGASLPQYTSASAKCRRIEFEKPPEPVPKIVVSYQRWYNDVGNLTGASHFWGPPIRGRDAQLEEGLQIWFVLL